MKWLIMSNTFSDLEPLLVFLQPEFTKNKMHHIKYEKLRIIKNNNNIDEESSSLRASYF